MARYVHTIFQIYSSCISDCCITSFTVCNLICIYIPSSFILIIFVSDYKLNPKPIRIYVPPFITSIKDSFIFPLNFRFVCCIGVLYYNISKYVHMLDKGWRISNFSSDFLHLKTGNNTMPLKLRPKLPPYVVFFMLYEFSVVRMKYFYCCMKLSLFNFYFMLFWNWNKWVLLGVSILLSRFYPVIKSEELDPWWTVLKYFLRYFYSKLPFFNFIFSTFFWS